MLKDIIASILTTDAIVVVKNSPDSPIVYTNPVFSQITGYSKEEVLGLSPKFLQGAKTDSASLARIKEAIEQKQTVNERLINYTKDGTEYLVDLTIYPYFDLEGVCTHFVAILKDITLQEKNLEDQLEKIELTRDKLDALLDTYPACS